MKFYVTQTFIPAKYSSFSVRTRNSMEHIRQMWSSAVRVTVSSSHRVSSRWNQAFLFLPNIATGALPNDTDLLLHPSQRARSTSLGFLLTTSSATSSLDPGPTLGGRWWWQYLKTGSCGIGQTRKPSDSLFSPLPHLKAAQWNCFPISAPPLRTKYQIWSNKLQLKSVTHT